MISGAMLPNVPKAVPVKADSQYTHVDDYFAGEAFGESQVSQLQDLVVDDDVGQLDVTVDHVHLVQGLHAIQQLLQVGNRLLLRNDSILAFPQLLEVALYISVIINVTIAVLHHQIAIVLTLQVLQHLHHIDVVALQQHLHFGLQQLPHQSIVLLSCINNDVNTI